MDGFVQGTDPRATPLPIDKVSTGVAGLDQVLNGGLPRGRPILISGGPGAGKTCLTYSYLRACSLRGEAVVLATFEERAADLRRHATTFGLDLAVMEEAGLLAIIDATLNTIEGGVVFDGQRTYESIRAACATLNAQHFVLDAFDTFTRTLERHSHERQEYIDLREWTLNRNLTTLVISKADREGHIVPHDYNEFLSYWVDCHVHLDQYFSGHAAIRRLRVRKYRGSSFRSGWHMFLIGQTGMQLVPLGAIDLLEETSRFRFSTGSDALDAVLGGGLMEGTINVLTGPTGSGKTVLKSMITRAAFDRGERILRLGMESSTRALFDFAKSTGYDLETPERQGFSKSIAVSPEAANTEELLFAMISLLDDFRPKMLLLESLTALNRLGDAELAEYFIMRLIAAARARAVTMVCTSSRPPDSASGIHLRGHHSDAVAYSALFDMIVDLDVKFLDDRMVRSLTVLKARGSAHSRHVHQFEIDDRGFHVDGTAQRKPR